MRRKQRTFRVVLDLPEYATLKDAREYIEDAVKTWCGSLYPGYMRNEFGEPAEDDFPDPMFDLDRASVKVFSRAG